MVRAIAGKLVLNRRNPPVGPPQASLGAKPKWEQRRGDGEDHQQPPPHHGRDGVALAGEINGLGHCCGCPTTNNTTGSRPRSGRPDAHQDASAPPPAPAATPTARPRSCRDWNTGSSRSTQRLLCRGAAPRASDHKAGRPSLTSSLSRNGRLGRSTRGPASYRRTRQPSTAQAAATRPLHRASRIIDIRDIAAAPDLAMPQPHTRHRDETAAFVRASRIIHQHCRRLHSHPPSAPGGVAGVGQR